MAHAERGSRKKRRKPIVAAFLSLISLGLGQIYNGELLKGLVMKVSLLFSLCLFAFLVFKSSQELVLWSFVILVFLYLKLYSIVQAIARSRRLSADFSLKKYHRSGFYAAVTIFFLALNVVLPLWIAKVSLAYMPGYHPFRSERAKERYHLYYEDKAKKWPVDSETRMISTSYGQTYVRISGPADAPPMVLMHGANATSLSWIPNIKALTAKYRTYAVDNIYDFGLSIFTKKFRTPDDFVMWMDELFSALNLGERIRLVGLSYGGWLTSQYALHHAGRLDKIVMIAPAATVLPLGPNFLKSALLSILPHRYFLQKGLKSILADLWKMEGEGQDYANEWVDQVDLGLRSFKPKMLVSPTVLSDEELKSLEVPVLFMVGENEKIYSPQEALSRLRRTAPQIETALIPGAGHDLTAVRADLVSQKILEFFESR